MSKTIQTTNQMKRESTTIYINPDLWKEVKIKAILKGISATGFFEEALQEKLNRENQNQMIGLGSSQSRSSDDNSDISTITSTLESVSIHNDGHRALQ
jgi:DNA topoisomerase IB